MHSNSKKTLRFLFILVFIWAVSMDLSAQDDEARFWDNVRFGGGVGLTFGNGFFGASVSPTAIYDFNQYFSLGPSLIFSYQEDDFFQSTLYGASVLALLNPIPEIQLSAEVEQLRVNQEFDDFGVKVEDDFWNTALFVGGGYNSGPVTVGIRYNVLFSDDDRVYADAWMPFVRVFF